MKEVMTYKSGKFYFSDEYGTEKVKNFLVRAEVLNEIIASLPILPELAASFEPEIMYGSIAGTAAIEGNPLTKEDVKKIAEGLDIQGYAVKDKQEIKNLIKVYKWLHDPLAAKDPFLLSEDFIRDLHKKITFDIPHKRNMPGNYRNGRVEVGDKAHGGVFVPPKCLEDVSALMAEYIEWINSREVTGLHPLVRAPLAHYYFSVIHPFWDGNGRTARFIEALILKAGGVKYMPRELSNYYYRNMDEYYIAFSNTNKLKKDVSPFMEFFLEAIVSSMEKIKKIIIDFIRIFSLRDYYTQQNQKKAITKRQFELLSLLLNSPVGFEFSLKDLTLKTPFKLLYLKVTTQTARRDLARLTDMGLLIVEGKKYKLNFRVLG